MVGGLAASAATAVYVESWVICALMAVMAAVWFGVMVLEFIGWRNDRIYEQRSMLLQERLMEARRKAGERAKE